MTGSVPSPPEAAPERVTLYVCPRRHVTTQSGSRLVCWSCFPGGRGPGEQVPVEYVPVVSSGGIEEAVERVRALGGKRRHPWDSTDEEWRLGWNDAIEAAVRVLLPFLTGGPRPAERFAAHCEEGMFQPSSVGEEQVERACAAFWRHPPKPNTANWNRMRAALRAAEERR